MPASDLLIPSPLPSLDRARERLAPPVRRTTSVWAALGSAFVAAVSALAAAATVILAAPAVGAPSERVHPPVSHAAP